MPIEKDVPEIKCPFCGATGDPDWTHLNQLKAHLLSGVCDEFDELKDIIYANNR